MVKARFGAEKAKNKSNQKKGGVEKAKTREEREKERERREKERNQRLDVWKKVRVNTKEGSPDSMFIKDGMYKGQVNDQYFADHPEVADTFRHILRAEYGTRPFKKKLKGEKFAAGSRGKQVRHGRDVRFLVELYVTGMVKEVLSAARAARLKRRPRVPNKRITIMPDDLTAAPYDIDNWENKKMGERLSEILIAPKPHGFAWKRGFDVNKLANSTNKMNIDEGKSKGRGKSSGRRRANVKRGKQAQAKAQDQAKAQNKAADLKQLRPAQFAKALKRANDLKSKSDPEKTEAGFGMF